MLQPYISEHRLTNEASRTFVVYCRRRTTISSMQKIYCYVDETGQDTEGAMFLVSIVLTEDERERLAHLLLEIEETSDKGLIKWHKTSLETKVEYLRRVFAEHAFSRSFFYAIYRNTKEYLDLTILATAKAIRQRIRDEDYRVTVVIDGMEHFEVLKFGASLRRLGIRTRKVRGVRDEGDCFVRLADAMAGFIRDALEPQPYTKTLFSQAKERGFIHEA